MLRQLLAFRVIRPKFLAGFRLQCHDAILPGGEIHDVANNDRSVLPGTSGVAGVIAPDAG